MSTFRSRFETALRVALIAVVLVNALIPGAALASNRGDQEASPLEEAPAAPRELPVAEPVYYQPPEIIEPQRTDPQGDEVPSRVPAKGDIELTLSANPNIPGPDGLVTLQASVRNHSNREYVDLIYKDKLESGL